MIGKFHSFFYEILTAVVESISFITQKLVCASFDSTAARATVCVCFFALAQNMHFSDQVLRYRMVGIDPDGNSLGLR
jgi:hypothetical protein